MNQEKFESIVSTLYPLHSLVKQAGEYVSHSVQMAFDVAKAVIASQAQQPTSEDQRAKLVVNMIKYLGATKTQAKAIVDGVFDGEHTISESDLQSQAQQTESQWISVEERLPEIDTPVLAVVGKNIYALARVEYDEGWLWGIGCNDLGDVRNYEADDDYQPTYWMPLAIPPAPEGDKP